MPCFGDCVWICAKYLLSILSNANKFRTPGTLRTIGYPSEINLRLKSREISFAHNSCSRSPLALKFCTEHGSIIAVLCAKFQIDWTIETDVVDERDLSFRINDTTTKPTRCPTTNNDGWLLHMNHKTRECNNWVWPQTSTVMDGLTWWDGYGPAEYWMHIHNH